MKFITQKSNSYLVISFGEITRKSDFHEFSIAKTEIHQLFLSQLFYPNEPENSLRKTVTSTPSLIKMALRKVNFINFHLQKGNSLQTKIHELWPHAARETAKIRSSHVLSHLLQVPTSPRNLIQYINISYILFRKADFLGPILRLNYPHPLNPTSRGPPLHTFFVMYETKGGGTPPKIGLYV